MAGVAITLSSSTISGGTNTAETVTTQEYADSTVAEAAVTARGFLPVVSPFDSTGKALKKRHIPVASIKEIASI